MPTTACDAIHGWHSIETSRITTWGWPCWARGRCGSSRGSGAEWRCPRRSWCWRRWICYARAVMIGGVICGMMLRLGDRRIAGIWIGGCSHGGSISQIWIETDCCIGWGPGGSIGSASPCTAHYGHRYAVRSWYDTSWIGHPMGCIRFNFPISSSWILFILNWRRLFVRLICLGHCRRGWILRCWDSLRSWCWCFRGWWILRCVWIVSIHDAKWPTNSDWDSSNSLIAW